MVLLDISYVRTLRLPILTLPLWCYKTNATARKSHSMHTMSSLLLEWKLLKKMYALPNFTLLYFTPLHFTLLCSRFATIALRHDNWHASRIDRSSFLRLHRGQLVQISRDVPNLRPSSTEILFPVCLRVIRGCVLTLWHTYFTFTYIHIVLSYTFIQMHIYTHIYTHTYTVLQWIRVSTHS